MQPVKTYYVVGNDLLTTTMVKAQSVQAVKRIMAKDARWLKKNLRPVAIRRVEAMYGR